MKKSTAYFGYNKNIQSWMNCEMKLLIVLMIDYIGKSYKIDRVELDGIILSQLQWPHLKSFYECLDFVNEIGKKELLEN